MNVPNLLHRIRNAPLALAFASTLAIAGWYLITVNVNFGGNWTALFCSGSQWPVPPELAENTYRFKNSTGYDGQLYRLVAHDPWLTRGFVAYSDIPALRWRRIFVPAIAWALALGNTAWIDTAYIFTVLCFSALGVYALARWLKMKSCSPAGGLLFLLLPGTLISIDRMTVDIALFALLFLCLIWDEESLAIGAGRFVPAMDIPLWLALAACVLTRDLGLGVIGAFCLAELASRRPRRAAWMVSAVLPAFLWFWHLRNALPAVSSHRITPEVATWAFAQSGYGIFIRMFTPTVYDLPAFQRVLALVLDQVALIGLIAAVVVTFLSFRWKTTAKLEWVGLAFAALFFIANTESLFRDLFSWARAYTPLLASVAFTENPRVRPWAWIPLAAVTLRIFLQFGSQLQGILASFR